MTAAKNLPVDQAIAYVRAGAMLVGTEAVSLNSSLCRVLAQDVIAGRDQPPFDASAMDGYAVRQSDLGAKTLTVIGQSVAGRRFTGAVAPGQAVRIFTGAPVPDDCDAILIQEHTRPVDGGIEILPDGRAPKAYIRHAGQDFKSGDVLLNAGVRLDAWRLSLAAAAGYDTVVVNRKPRIAVLCNGDELVLPGQTPGPDQIYESASAAVMALIVTWGGEASYLGIEGDDAKAIYDTLKDVKADLIVTIGGASVGDHDLVKPALERLGLALDFVSLSLRPGKPTSFGVLANGTRVLGVPGNPASAFVVAQLLLKPWIEASIGIPASDPFRHALCLEALSTNGPRESYLRARLNYSDMGQVQVTPFSDQDSSLVSVFAEADALIRQSANAPATSAGALIDIIPLERL